MQAAPMQMSAPSGPPTPVPIWLPIAGVVLALAALGIAIYLLTKKDEKGPKGDTGPAGAAGAAAGWATATQKLVVDDDTGTSTALTAATATAPLTRTLHGGASPKQDLWATSGGKFTLGIDEDDFDSSDSSVTTTDFVPVLHMQQQGVSGKSHGLVQVMVSGSTNIPDAIKLRLFHKNGDGVVTAITDDITPSGSSQEINIGPKHVALATDKPNHFYLFAHGLSASTADITLTATGLLQY